VSGIADFALDHMALENAELGARLSFLEHELETRREMESVLLGMLHLALSDPDRFRADMRREREGHRRLAHQVIVEIMGRQETS
jgi:hypothetical protein